ncbi:hypothetical protein A2U01_0054458 [Trifolium medium]|uniref:Uncharacterized protein n=1 Tax=Trifolium medium TaxID=97028 RepID=A0A392R9J0_9FABA|nr:hypothetical protein [Trifolium medium]
MHTPKSDPKDSNPVDQSQEVPVPTMQMLMEDESKKLDEPNNMHVISDNFRKASVHVISKTKKPKKTPKRSIKRKRFKWRIKKEKLKSDSEDMCSWLVSSKVAPLQKVNKRSWVEAKLKYPP